MISPELGSETNKGFYKLVACEGHLLAGRDGGVSEYDGEGWTNYNLSTAAPILSIACDPAGGFWAADAENIYHYQKGKQETYSQKMVFNAEMVILQIAIDPRGAVWALSLNRVSSFREGNWAAIDLGEQTPMREWWFTGFAFDAKGTLWIYALEALSYLEGTSLQREEFSEYVMLQIDSLFIDSDDRIWVHMRGRGFFIWDGKEWNPMLRMDRPEIMDTVIDMAEDESGRMWFAGSYGLAVADGDRWTTYRMDNSDIPVNDLSSVAVIGPGPLSLPAIKQKQTGTVRGTIFYEVGQFEKNPLADMGISLCVEPFLIWNAGMLTCEAQPFYLNGKTDGQGTFLFEQVPVGYYQLMPVFPATTLWDDDPRLIENPILVEEGKTLDLGKIYWRETPHG